MIQTTLTGSRQPGHDPECVQGEAADDCLNVGLVENEETERGSIKPLITPEIVDKIKKNGLNKIRMAFKLSIFV